MFLDQRVNDKKLLNRLSFLIFNKFVPSLLIIKGRTKAIDGSVVKMKLNKKLPILSIRELLHTTISNLTLKHYWKRRTPLQKWSYLYGIGRQALNLTGIRSFREDHSLSLYSYFGISYLGAYMLLAAYTMVYYIHKGEIVRGLECMCIFGPVVAVCL